MFPIFSVLLLSSTVLSSYSVGTGNSLKNTSQSLKNNEFFPNGLPLSFSNGLPLSLPKYDTNETKLNQLKFSSHINLQPTSPQDKILESSCLNKTSLYTSYKPQGLLDVIDIDSNTVINTIPVGTDPLAMAFDFKDQLYVNHEDTNIVSIINTTTNTVTKKIFVSGGIFKSEGNIFFNDNLILFDKTSKKLILNTEDSLEIIDTNTNTVTNSINFESGIQAMIVDDSKQLLYIASIDSHSTNDIFVSYLSIFDLNKNQITKNIILDKPGIKLSVDQIQNKLYIAETIGPFPQTSSITVIDTNTMEKINSIPLEIGLQFTGMEIDPIHSKLYISGSSGLSLLPIKVIDTKTDTIINQFFLGNTNLTPLAIDTFDINHSRLYVEKGGFMYVINTNNDTIVSTIQNLRYITGIELEPIKDKLYLSEWLDFSVAVINPNTGIIEKHIPVGFRPYELLVAQQKCPNIANIDVQVNSSELNPYPSNIDPPEPKSQIKITTKNSDGTPAPLTDVKVETCSLVGRQDSDGHIHDQSVSSDICHQSQRPQATLSDGISKGNPLSVKTDSNGKITLDYIPSSSIGSDGKKYYISGKDKIVASLQSNPDIKNDANTITTKVPNLLQMPNSGNCLGNELYYFESQTNHDCIFYGTENTNNNLIQLAEDFNKRQTDCSESSKPKDETACDVTIEGSEKKDFVTINADNIIPLKITAMSLPWGGLLDKNGDWNIPYFNHNDGKNADVGFNIKGNEMTIDQKMLLRDVILDSGHLLPYAEEGKEDDVTLAKDHFHIEFVDCSSDNTSNSLSAMQSPDICGQKLEGKIDLKILMKTPGTTQFLPLEGIEIQLLPTLSSKPVLKDITNEKGEYKIDIPPTYSNELFKIRFELSKLKEDSSNNQKKVFEVHYKDLLSPTVFVEAPIFPIIGSDRADFTFQDTAGSSSQSSILLNGNNLNNAIIPPGLPMNNMPHLASIYYYINEGMKFKNQYLNLPANELKALKIVGFSNKDTTFRFDGINGNDMSIMLSNTDSVLAGLRDFSGNKISSVEIALDSIFHEFGHYLVFSKVRENIGAEFHPEVINQINIFLQNTPTTDPLYSGYQSFLNDGATCHYGYLLKDSQCSMDEGGASFLSAAISDKIFKLDDPAHADFKRNAPIYLQGINTAHYERLDLEAGRNIDNNIKLNIVGTETNKAVDKRINIFHKWNDLHEETSIASVLWDLYDGQTSNIRDKDGDGVSISLLDLWNHVLTGPHNGIGTTLNDVYINLRNSGHINQANQLKYNEILSNFNICVDNNNNGRCTPSEVIEGKSAWKFKITEDHGLIVQYPKNQPRP